MWPGGGTRCPQRLCWPDRTQSVPDRARAWRALGVDVATAAVQLQPEALPGAERCCRVVCGSAGYVAGASRHEDEGSVSVLAAGSLVRLQLLHQSSTCQVAAQLSFAASGLHCCRAEIDTQGPEGTLEQAAEVGCFNACVQCLWPCQGAASPQLPVRQQMAVLAGRSTGPHAR